MTEDHFERIRLRAHAIWEQQGRPEGAAEAHWIQASAEVLGQHRSAAPRKRSATRQHKNGVKTVAVAAPKRLPTLAIGDAKRRRSPSKETALV